MSAWLGMNATTGASLGDLGHIWQSVRKILTTPLGSRVERREFGSLIPALIDQPLNAATRLKVIAATAAAVIRWEPRIRPQKIALTLGSAPSAVVVDLVATRRDGPRAGEQVTLSIPVLG